VYQKLAGSENEAILKEFEDDLRDEYGAPPEQVKNLFAVLQLKIACRHSGVTRIKKEVVDKHRDDLVLTLSPRVTAKEIMQLLSKNPQWRISGSSLRIDFAEIQRGTKKDIEWLHVLTEQVEALARKKSEKKAKE
jgi:transcription-repair coupling factor (superfamily II helicase)